MVNRGTKRPYIHFLGNASTEVTGSMWLVRFQKYCILLDCGLIQGHDIATDYRLNKDMLKRIKPKEIDWIILSHCHIDHSGLIPALYAKGCQAHIIAPSGSVELLRLLWQDSMKIMQQDTLKLQRKHGIKAAPFYTQEDIERALDRIIDVDNSYSLTSNISMRYFYANHIINSRQVYLELREGYRTYRIGFTGDIGGEREQPYVNARQTLPFVDVLIGENTYNTPSRPNKAYDRDKDREKITTVVAQYPRVLFPVFSLGRTQTILTELYRLWEQGKIPHDIKVVVDSPLAIKFCKLYPKQDDWDKVLHWENVQYVEDWETSQALQLSHEPMVLLSASGFMQGGRVRSWLKSFLPDRKAVICYCGFSGDNGTAYEIRHGDKLINIDGEMIENKCNIIELVSFSSHANYEELMSYYGDECRFLKLALVHGNYEAKVAFANTLQNKLVSQGKSARVVAVNAEQKIYL